MCCKLMGVAELDKPLGTLCTHCDEGRGCRIYDERPSSCRGFYCGYLISPMMADHWFPALSKMVIAPEFGGQCVAIHVDPSCPDAWRQEPYYSDLKRWSAFAARDLRQVIVCVDNRSIVILPDEDVDLGVVSEEERVVLSEVPEDGRLKLRAMKIRADDSRLAGAEAGAIYMGQANRFG